MSDTDTDGSNWRSADDDTDASNRVSPTCFESAFGLDAEQALPFADLPTPMRNETGAWAFPKRFDTPSASSTSGESAGCAADLELAGADDDDAPTAVAAWNPSVETDPFSTLEQPQPLHLRARCRLRAVTATVLPTTLPTSSNLGTSVPSSAADLAGPPVPRQWNDERGDDDASDCVTDTITSGTRSQGRVASDDDDDAVPIAGSPIAMRLPTASEDPSPVRAVGSGRLELHGDPFASCLDQNALSAAGLPTQAVPPASCPGISQPALGKENSRRPSPPATGESGVTHQHFHLGPRGYTR